MYVMHKERIRRIRDDYAPVHRTPHARRGDKELIGGPRMDSRGPKEMFSRCDRPYGDTDHF